MNIKITNYTNSNDESICVHHSPYLILKGQLSQEEGGDFPSSLQFHSKEIIKSALKTLKVSSSSYSEDSERSFTLVAELSEGTNSLEFSVPSLPTGITQLPPVTYLKAEGRNSHSVVPLLVFPSDGPAVESSQLTQTFLKLTVALKLVQTVYGELLAGQGFSRRSFFIDEDLHKTILPLDISTSELSQMDTYEVWEHVARTLRKTENIWSESRKYVAFLTSPWNNSGRTFKSALGGGGLAILNLAVSDPWPSNLEDIFELLWNTQPLETQYPHLLPVLNNYGSIGRSVGDFVSASLGSLAHELGHLFDLGHSEFGLMGRDFHKFIRLILNPQSSQDLPDYHDISRSSATLIYFHKWFQGSTPVQTTNSSFQVSSNSRITSTHPLTTIQLRTRSDSDALVLKEWTFASPTFDFLPQKGDIPLTSCPSGEATLICQNASGVLLKLPVSRLSLITSFTRLTPKSSSN